MEIVAHDDLVVIRQAGTEVITTARSVQARWRLARWPMPKGQPDRGVRPRTAAEVAFLGLGPAAETFLRSAAAAVALPSAAAFLALNGRAVAPF